MYAAQNAFRFSTKFQDSETGLIYYGHRYYSPRDGRFINRDPIQEQGGLNLYGFCGNDGINHWDYLGQSWFSNLWKKIKKAFKKYAGMIAGIIIGAFTGGILGPMLAKALGVTSKIIGGAITGAIGGFTSGVTGTLLSGGSIGQALKSGLWGALSGGISGGIGGYFGHETGTFTNELKRALAHGVAQGTINVLRGQKFGPAFAAGFLGSAVGSVLSHYGVRTYAAVPLAIVAGGVGARITGGSFAEGAISAAAIQLYNHIGPKLEAWANKLLSSMANAKEKAVQITEEVVESTKEAVKAAGETFKSAAEGIAGAPEFWRQAIVDPNAPGAGFIAAIEGAGEGVVQWANNHIDLVNYGIYGVNKLAADPGTRTYVAGLRGLNQSIKGATAIYAGAVIAGAGGATVVVPGVGPVSGTTSIVAGSAMMTVGYANFMLGTVEFGRALHSAAGTGPTYAPEFLPNISSIPRITY